MSPIIFHATCFATEYQRPRIPTGRGRGLKIPPVWVRIPPGAPLPPTPSEAKREGNPINPAGMSWCRPVKRTAIIQPKYFS